MKWLFSVHKATQRLLSSQRYDGASPRRFFNASNPIVQSKPDQMRSSCIYSAHYYSTSHGLPNSNNIENDVHKVDLEIISRETIKPSSPTPHHLRAFNLSIIDQLMYDVYTPFFIAFPNTDKASVTDVETKRLKHLKESLSKILTKFYPLAGKVKDNLLIECTDEGIYYTEARVNQTLEDFLGQPDDERVRQLMPEKPCTEEPSIGNYVIGIQVNIFKCGGIGISTSMSHKIVDAYTFHMFMDAWAKAARGSREIVSPSFIASEIFPNNPSLEYSMPTEMVATKKLSTKRFVFNSNALALLKAQPVANASSAHPPTRVEATAAVVWKAAALAASKVRTFGPHSPHVIFSAVNIRKRTLPALPRESIGNVVDSATAICFPDLDLDLPTLMGQLRESIAKVNSDYIESIKGEKGHETFNETMRRLKQLMDVTVEGDCLLATSALKSGVYELDFGWGKPVWFYVMNSRAVRRVTLNDTLKGDGVEAIVTLSPEEMEIFEHDSGLLSYATVNPSPLRFVH